VVREERKEPLAAAEAAPDHDRNQYTIFLLLLCGVLTRLWRIYFGGFGGICEYLTATRESENGLMGFWSEELQ